MDDYQYQPLPDPTKFIRRVTIQPGSGSDVIVVDLEILPFGELFDESNIPKYEALSYVWGTTVNPVSLRVAHPDGAVINVTQNLAAALQHLRFADKTRVMWIDALCINQCNNNEKGPQVAMMGAIFQRATRVVAWLGPEDNDSDHALRFLSMLGIQVKVDLNSHRIKFNLARGAMDLTLADPTQPLKASPRDMVAVHRLLSRQWFDRLWIRQEIYLASSASIKCGNSEVPWPVLRRALMCSQMKRKAENAPVGLNHRLDQLRGLTAQDADTSLQNLRENFGLAECKDPRDRVYAILDLLSRDYARKIVPDYSKSRMQVYKDAVVQWINHYDSLDILRECYLREDPRPSWLKDNIRPSWFKEDARPSWVADWSSVSFTWEQATLEAIHVSPKLAAWFEMPAEGVLRVTGVATTIIDELQTTGIRRGNYHYEDAFMCLRKALIRFLKGKLDWENAESFATLTSLLSADLDANFYEPPNKFQDDRKEYESLVSDLLSPTFRPYEGHLHEGKEMYYAFLMALSLCRGKQLFRGTNGTIGLAPANALPGDIGCALLGCSMPILLRPTENDSYHVVGACIIPGLSSGEAFLGKLPANIRLVRVGTQREEVLGFRDESTGIVSFEDPRLSKISMDLTEYRQKLEADALVQLQIGPDVLRESGVDMKYFNLV